MADLSIEIAQPHEVFAILELIEELLMELQDEGVDIPWVPAGCWPSWPKTPAVWR
jgi:hypothetical protein